MVQAKWTGLATLSHFTLCLLLLHTRICSLLLLLVGRAATQAPPKCVDKIFGTATKTSVTLRYTQTIFKHTWTYSNSHEWMISDCIFVYIPSRIRCSAIRSIDGGGNGRVTSLLASLGPGVSHKLNGIYWGCLTTRVHLWSVLDFISFECMRRRRENDRINQHMPNGKYFSTTTMYIECSSRSDRLRFFPFCRSISFLILLIRWPCSTFVFSPFSETRFHFSVCSVFRTSNSEYFVMKYSGKRKKKDFVFERPLSTRASDTRCMRSHRKWQQTAIVSRVFRPNQAKRIQ